MSAKKRPPTAAVRALARSITDDCVKESARITGELATSRVIKYQYCHESLSKAVSLVLCSFGNFISAEGTDQELELILAKHKKSTAQPTPVTVWSLKAARELMEKLGLTWEELVTHQKQATKWAVLRQKGGPFLIHVEVYLQEDDGDKYKYTYALVYHDRCLKSHLPRKREFSNIRNADISSGQKAGKVFDRFLESADWASGLTYAQCRILGCWEVKKRAAQWEDADFHTGPLVETAAGDESEKQRFPNYHREALPTAVALIAAGMEGTVQPAPFARGLASVTAAAATSCAAGPGNLNMGTVQGFLMNKGFSCDELSDHDTKGVLRKKEGFFLFVLSVLVKSKRGNQMYMQHAVGYHKHLLRSCLTKEKPFKVLRSQVLKSDQVEQVFDAYFEETLANCFVTYKHCVVLGVWKVDKMKEEEKEVALSPSRTKRALETDESNSRSPTMRSLSSCDARRSRNSSQPGRAKKSRSVSHDSADSLPVPMYSKGPPDRLFQPITGESRSIPDALSLLLKKANFDGADVPYYRLTHDDWLESVKGYFRMPVKRYLDSKGLKLEALPQGVLHSHLGVLKQVEGNHLLVLTINFEDDKHGHVPMITHGVVWLARQRLLLDSRTAENPIEVKGQDTRSDLSARRVFDALVRPLAGNRVYQHCVIRSAYKLKRCFSKKPASHYGLGPKRGQWSPDC
eukprot:Sro599_g173230.2  (686) ;mRNA; r:28641-30698